MRIDKIAESPRTTGRPRILVVYQYIALYRFPVFRSLAQSEEFEFIFAAGTTSKGETPRYASTQELTEAEFVWFPLQNRWLPAHLLWQSGLLKAVANRNVQGVIFLGDMHYLSTWAGLLLCKLLGKPAYLWTIGMHRPEGGLKLAVRLRFFRLARHIFVYGDYARGLMRDAGVPDSKMTTIANSLDFDTQQALYEQIASAASPPQEDSDRFDLISIGRLTERRRLDLLIEALAQLVSEGRDIQLRLIGDGPEKTSLQDLAQRLGIADRTAFLGAIYDEEVVARHAYAADLCVVPGVIGLGAVHAHGYGLPVITCGDHAIQAPEAEIIVPGETGAFCPWDDLPALTNLVRDWIDAGHDRGAVRTACLAAVERKWNPARQKALFEAILRRRTR
jgi:glycosyltransferase involved in cell wall biosynthesis